jgi:signal transduction histidine kinase
MAARIALLRKYYKVWTASVAACLATLIVAAVLLPKSFALLALSDIVQCVLLLSGTLSLSHHILRTDGRLRLFWMLTAAAIGLWFCYQVLWVYFEVFLRAEVPDLFVGDIVLFLHIVPLMAALALRPHVQQDEYAARLRNPDFALLLVWWVYLYVLAVIPWQYVIPDATPYLRNLNSLYLIEKVALLSTILLSWKGSKNGWRKFYASLFGACLTYAVSSYVANWALSRRTYYTGSLYDIPLAFSMAWITIIGLWTPERNPLAEERSAFTHDGVWLARVGMIAAFSLPLLGIWSLLEQTVAAPIKSFRLELTLAAAILIGIMVFVRQRLLDRELLRLLTNSQQSFANLKRLQTQITESEKLASIGQLVAGAAHELNNPITAMLGYSDLLVLSKPLSAEQSGLAAKIGQNARRTRSLVASLLSFAKPTAASFAPVDIKTLLSTAIRLSQSQWQSRQTEIETAFSQELLLVRGDSNQLLQVCVQIINDALRAIDRRQRGKLIVSTQSAECGAVIQISDGMALEPGEKKPDSGEILSSLGLSACQTILGQHQGRLFCQEDANSAMAIRVELPLIGSAQEKSNGAPVPAWQPQPFF